MTLSQRRTFQVGVGLIEVLVALFVISVGMLGVAKMQALALASTGISARRGIAAIQAAGLASTMHANKDYWAKGGVAPANVSISGATITNSALAGQSRACNTAQCTSLQMAAFDLNEWVVQLNDSLPGAEADIKCSQTTNLPVTCTIEVRWHENSVALNSNASEGLAEQAPTYTLFVEP